MQSIKMAIGLVISAALLLTGCTEDRQEQKILKPQDVVFSKSNIDTQANYLYAPLGQESSRTSLYGRSFEVGQSKVVKLQINEFSLDVLSIEKDDRFSDNPNNQKLLISIPIEHVDYRCADDAYGECIGNEVENERITWDQKKFFKAKFADAKIVDTNFFSYEFAGQGQCYSEENSELLARSITSNSLNFTLKRDYKDELFFFCIRNHDLSDFTNLNWTETTSYSLVKLADVASPDYPKAVYHPDWINTFGFFETDDYQLDVDGNATQNGEIKYMQRWNPNRSEIVYHLSESFNKPQNAALKAATYESFNRLNSGLAKAGAKFRLKLAEPSAESDPSDLRKSMVILVDDPAASSVIGYGPSIVNPLTGEVIAARTMMYSGSIRKFVRFTYEDIVRDYGKEATTEGATAPSSGATQASNLSESLGNLSADFAMPMSRLEAQSLVDFSKIDALKSDVIQNQVSRTPELSEDEIDHFMKNEANKDYMKLLAEQNKYPAEALSFGEVSQDMLQQLIAEVGQLKPWETLTDLEKQGVLNVLTPYVWVPTLIHEIGHNLGLRHNFSGSEDADNFYAPEEVAALAIPALDAPMPYSSVMDYPKSEVNALRALGKYDIAALQFGYADAVTLEDGSIAKVDSAKTPTEGLKAYQYCSDEGVAPNPSCNPFDEGVTMVEMAQSMIDSYEERYTTSNFRRGRANFSGLGDDRYLASKNRTFRNLRLIFERYESLVNDFDLDQETIDSVPWLSELDQAVELATDFMIKVIKTPDTVCIIQDRATGQLQPAPIGIFSQLAHDRTRRCSDLQLNEQFMVVGEGGKPLNSLKLPSNPNRYADQIDVRGTWIDKALAMRTLFRRTVGSTLHDDVNGNFLDHPKSAPKIMQLVQDMMTNNMVAPVDIQFVDGTKTTANLGVRFDDGFYEIPAPELPLPNWILGLPYMNMTLPEALTMVLQRNVAQGSDSPTKTLMLESLKVYRFHPNPGSRDYLSIDANGEELFVHRRSQLAATLVTAAQRASFYESTGLDMGTLASLLEKMEAEANKPPVFEDPKEETPVGENAVTPSSLLSSSSPAEQAVIQLGAEPLRAYLNNPTSSDYMKRILLSL